MKLNPMSAVNSERRARLFLWAACVALALLCSPASPDALAQSDGKKDDKKKIVEPFKVQKLTQGMGLYALGSISPDKQSILLLAQKPEQAPNLYVMNISDHSIRPPLTSFKWGAGDSAWSPDGLSVALAGFNETATFSELYILDLRAGKMRQVTSNAFSD